MSKPGGGPITSGNKVCQIDMNTFTLVNIYISYAEADRQTGIRRSDICRAINERGLSAGGFYWCLEKD